MTEDSKYDTIELCVNGETVYEAEVDISSSRNTVEMGDKERVEPMPDKATIEMMAERFGDQVLNELIKIDLMDFNWVDYHANGNKHSLSELREQVREREQRLREKYPFVDYRTEYNTETGEYERVDSE